MSEWDEERIKKRAKRLVEDLLDLQKGRWSMEENEWTIKVSNFIRQLLQEI